MKFICYIIASDSPISLWRRWWTTITIILFASKWNTGLVKLRHAFSICVVVLSPAPAALAGTDCLTTSLAVPGRAAAPAVQLLAAKPQSAALQVSCRGDSLARLQVRLSASEQATVVLAVDGLVDVVAEGEDGRLTEWTRIEFDASHPIGLVPVTVGFNVPENAAAGMRLDGRLQLRVNRQGTESTIAVPLSLEVVEDQPLFRDDFGVDPVIGQFSMVR